MLYTRMDIFCSFLCSMNWAYVLRTGKYCKGNLDKFRCDFDATFYFSFDAIGIIQLWLLLYYIFLEGFRPRQTTLQA